MKKNWIKAANLTSRSLHYADIVPLDALGERVTQSDRICALHEGSNIARIDQRKTAQPLPEKYGSTHTIGETSASAEHEDQAWLLVSVRGNHLRVLTTVCANFIGNQCARKQGRH